MELPIEQHQQIVQGDDYTDAVGRPLTWYVPEGPNLAAAELTMVIGYDSPNVYGAVPVAWTSTMPGVPTPTSVARLMVTQTQTRELSEGCYDYTLRATLSGGAVVTIAAGKLTVQAEPGLAALMPAQP